MAAAAYIAFLRAVNIGGRVVKMADLVRIVEGLGHTDVSTFIASGNVIFRSGTRRGAAAVQRELESALGDALGYPVATMLRTRGEVAAAAAFEAFTAAEMTGASLYVGFMHDLPSTAAVRRATALQTTTDRLRAHRGEIFWLARKNMSEATITGAAIEKALGTAVTFRNITTVRRLAAKYPA